MTEIPYCNTLSEDELLQAAEQIMGAPNVSGKTYEEIVTVLTLAMYVFDVCVLELEQRDLLEFFRGSPVIPDARPDSLFIEHVLTRPRSRQS